MLTKEYTDMAADQISRVASTFDTTKREDVESELVGEACAKARKKADLLAKGAGVTIAGVHSIGSDGFDSLHGWFSHGFSALPSFGAGENAAEIPLFVPTSIELSTSVSIIYRLAP